MKNIFLARTGAPTRLYKNAQGVFELRDKQERVTDETSQNYWMYIITEESFSQGDFITDDYVSASRVRSTTIEALKENGCYEQFKKVILTTHGYLINEGIQSIDDEFLEWFVKNPSCEFVHVIKNPFHEPTIYRYKIIIPQEEPKQDRLKELYLKNNPKKAIVIEERVNNFMKQLKPKQETLEEAAANLADPNLCKTDNWIAGAIWQSEKMYSEEDIARAFNEGMAYETMGKYIKGEEWVKTHKKEWFEQVKKK
jgi:hypothetical protein